MLHGIPGQCGLQPFRKLGKSHQRCTAEPLQVGSVALFTERAGGKNSISGAGLEKVLELKLMLRKTESRDGAQDVLSCTFVHTARFSLTSALCSAYDSCPCSSEDTGPTEAIDR